MIETIGRFRVLERIGRGGMGMVFKAHDPTLDRVVAVKVISPEAKMSDEIKARFYREAHACAQLNHRSIILTDAELQRIRASFAQSKSQTVELSIESIVVNGDEAQVRGRRLDVFVPQEGRLVRNEAPFLFGLKRTTSGWVIRTVN
jgi:serine/threonine protein kinase